MLKIILMVMILITTLQAEWRWAQDTSKFTFDKEAHFVGSFGIYFMFRHKDFSELDSFKYTFYCGIGKEVIDALVPHEKYGKVGGDGFSKYDLGYNLLGIGIAYGIDKLWKPKEKSNDYTIRFNTGGVSISYWLP